MLLTAFFTILVFNNDLNNLQMLQNILNAIKNLRPHFETDEMCFMALNGGFEFELKNKLAYQLNENNINDNLVFVKEVTIRNNDNSKIVDVAGIEKSNPNSIAYAIELGHNYISQPTEFVFNKANEDIRKCNEAGINKEIYLVQIVTEIFAMTEDAKFIMKKSYHNEALNNIKQNATESKLTNIRNFYQNNFGNIKEFKFSSKWRGNKTYIYIFVVSTNN
jgi:hypothetical protein